MGRGTEGVKPTFKTDTKSNFVQKHKEDWN